MKTKFITGALILSLLSGCGNSAESTATTQSISPQENLYTRASSFFDEGNYLDAAQNFLNAGTYQDSETRAKESLTMYMDSSIESATPQFAKLLLSMGEESLYEEVAYEMRMNNASVIATDGGDNFIAILPDGTVSTTIELHNASEWTDIVSVSIYHAVGFSNDCHVLGLKSDGSVVASGDNSGEQGMVGGWSDIVMIATSVDLSVGLSATGEIFLAGEIEMEEMNQDYIMPVINTWNGWGSIEKIYSKNYHIVVMTNEGKCFMTDNYFLGMSHAVDTVATATAGKGFVDFSMGSHHYIGLFEDGTVYADGRNDNWELDVGGWSDIVQVVASSQPYMFASQGYCAGLKSDGTVVVSGDNQDVKSEVATWTDIVFLTAGIEGSMLIGVTSEGTLKVADASSKVESALEEIASVKLPSGS